MSESHDSFKTGSQNDKYFRIERNTAWIAGLIIGALIFVSNMFGTWILQSKDISILTTNVQALTIDQKLQDAKIILTSERVAILENTGKSIYNDMCEIKKDIKLIREDQLVYFKRAGIRSSSEKSN